jgi:hypothetical protein
MRRFALKSVFALLLASPILLPAQARADETIRRPGDHPDYGVEIEPHGLIGWWDNGLAGNAFGVGGRFSIPIVKNGFVKTINNSVAITFGADLLWGSWCNAGCGVTSLDFPVALQWNFYVAQRWSVFGEAGLYIWHNFYGDCTAAVGCPGQPGNGWVDPAFFAGGRYHFNDKVSLTMRIGFPTASVGVSFFL